MKYSVIWKTSHNFFRLFFLTLVIFLETGRFGIADMRTNGGVSTTRKQHTKIELDRISERCGHLKKTRQDMQNSLLDTVSNSKCLKINEEI